jgi:hypothetical protein
LEKLVALFLFIDENQDAAFLVPQTEQLQQAQEFIFLLQYFDKLSDILVAKRKSNLRVSGDRLA